MKTIKKVLLLTAIGVLSFIALSCSPEEDDTREPEQQGCECERIETEVRVWANSSGTGFNRTEEEFDRYPVQCQEEVEEFYFYNNEINGVVISRYYDIVCTGNQNKESEANYRILCSGNGFMVITNDIFWKINGEIVTQQEATDKCNEING